MVSSDNSKKLLKSTPLLKKYSAIAVGPGLRNGAHSKKLMKQLLEKVTQPLIIDADGLNTLAESPKLLSLLPQQSILTPHPGEMDRLVGKSSTTFDRLQKAKELSLKHQIIIVLKGANTCIVLPNGSFIFNPTGNAGMATAGSGDVLTGVILSLLAQGYSSEQAAIYGVYIHGLAGDLAAKEIGMDSLIASVIIQFLPKAFLNIHNNDFGE